jgi:phenylacetate-coenzyme A ligase PaaK-like adenylate-forming protein
MLRLTPLEPWIAQKIKSGNAPLTRAAIEAYQLERLRNVTAMAIEKSSFYRRRLAAVDPAGFHDLADFQRLPFTTGDDLREEGIRFLCVSQSDIARVVTLDTSGTTGKPKRCYFTRPDQDLTIDFFGIGMSTLVGIGDRVLILLPCELAGSVGDLLQAGLQRRGITAIKHGPVSDPFETLSRMDEEKITALVGVPVQVLALARLWQEAADPKCSPPKNILLSTDYVPEAVVTVLKEIWDCEVYNHYGMTEMGLGGGVSCGAQTGYHLREADFFFEIVDPKSGAVLPDGESGEVVLSTLTRQGMPFIRYRTGDLSRFIPEPCPCGTILKTMEFLRLRISGIHPLDAESLSICDLDEALFPLAGLIDYSASLYDEADHVLLCLDIRFLPGKGLPEDQICQAVEHIPAVRASIQSGRLRIRIDRSDTLPPELGKMKKRTINVYGR